ncbi:hypothetical protein D3C85_236640 [compost metagenome]
MRGMHEAPARIDVDLVVQILHRAPAAIVQALAHLALLLGDVDVDGAVHGQRLRHFTDLRHAGRAQGMGRKAHLHLPAALRRQRFDDAQDIVRTGAKARLLRFQRLFAKTRMAVQHGQHGHADAAEARRGQHPFRRFGGARIQRAGRIALQVVKFADSRVAMAQAFGKQLRGDAFHLLRRDVVRETVHQLAPGPEAVRAITGDFRHAAQRPLERVRMQVDHAGQDVFGHFRAGRRRGVVRHHRQIAGRVPLQQHVAAPALRQQRVARKQAAAQRATHATAASIIWRSSGCTCAARSGR